MELEEHWGITEMKLRVYFSQQDEESNLTLLYHQELKNLRDEIVVVRALILSFRNIYRNRLRVRLVTAQCSSSQPLRAHFAELEAKRSLDRASRTKDRLNAE